MGPMGHFLANKFSYYAALFQKFNYMYMGQKIAHNKANLIKVYTKPLCLTKLQLKMSHV